MSRINERIASYNNVYDDYMEPLSNIREEYQEFLISSKKYVKKEKKGIWDNSFKGGIPILRDEEKKSVFVDDQDTHTLIIGATGSKKTRLIVMPTVRLLGWAGESMIISDPKAEIYNRTAGELEEQGYRVVVLNFRNPSYGDTWNPLDIPYQFYQNGNIDRACEMVNDIAKNIIAADQNVKDPFWMDSAADMFFGLVLTLFKLCTESGQEKMTVNISNVLRLRRQLFDNNEPVQKPIWKYVQDDEVIAPALSGIVMTADDTRAGILSTFDQKVRFFVYQPNLMDMLANNSVMLDRISEEKTAVYLIMPDEKTTYHTLISLFVKQSYEYLIYRAQKNEKGQVKIRLNYILDEFSSLPTIKDFPTMITAARSRNIRFHLVMQSKYQLRKRYGDETESIQSNCGNWIFLTSREVPLLEELSKLCGTVQQGTIPLISIFTLQHLDKESGQALVLSNRKRPFYAELPDINEYDDNKYRVRKSYGNAVREDRVDIFGNKTAKKILKKNNRNSVFGDELVEEDLDGLLCEYPEYDKMMDGELVDRSRSVEKNEQNNLFIYAMEANNGYEAYIRGEYSVAKNCFINALSYRDKKDTSCDCENNLAYMLRRKEIDSVEIAGINYSVPELLEKGILEKKAFCLVNMALYCCQVEEFFDLNKGDFYIKKIETQDITEIKQWWEGVAERGEAEGYIVLFWLYQNQLISDSSLGDKEEIIKILENRYQLNLGNYGGCSVKK